MSPRAQLVVYVQDCHEGDAGLITADELLGTGRQNCCSVSNNASLTSYQWQQPSLQWQNVDC